MAAFPDASWSISHNSLHKLAHNLLGHPKSIINFVATMEEPKPEHGQDRLDYPICACMPGWTLS